ncbi:MAG TPA: hypothetical protein VLK56_10275 [Solirubrobacterales bacterium]|nr:hypothetical protein [Solirubrobacterales bacterium]
MGEHDASFAAMGSRVRLPIGEPQSGIGPAVTTAGQVEQFVGRGDAVALQPRERAVR